MPEIGDWVRRYRGHTPYHYVDSTVDDRVVTRCGRQMASEDRAGRPLAVWVGARDATPYDSRNFATAGLPPACVTCEGSVRAA